MSGDFTPEQKRYLEGFMSGVQVARAGKPAGVPAESVPSGPDAEHTAAQNRTTAAGGKLADQEKWKRDEHPFDAYARLRDEAAQGQYPKPPDNFRLRYHGLFYVAPTQNSFMCRLRIPNGILTHWQLAGVAALAERHGGGYAHVTTRANLQIREIAAEHAIPLVEALAEIGLIAKGSGADNIRNVTGTPTAGIDPQELVDTRAEVRAWHHHILNDRGLYGLPRKFNVAFDGAGRIAALEETNDIGFRAVEVLDGAGVTPGVWWRLALGGITGHKDLARDTDVIVPIGEATRVADAIVRVFIANGDRTNRNKARLKYVLDAWGFEKFLAVVEEKLGSKLTRVPTTAIALRPAPDRMAHLGVHPQKQTGLNWIGVGLPVGRMTGDQMRALADIARAHGDGDIRLTVWQNLLISGVGDGHVAAAVAAIEAAGLTAKASAIRAGLVACTGNTGCKFAAANTKGTAEAIAMHVEARLALDTPVNIHLTGCHHSCAQHYIGDIGLIACRIDSEGDAPAREGFHMVIGGGTGPDAAIGREIYRDIPSQDCPAAVEKVLATYLAKRTAGETFHLFAKRHEIDALKSLIGEIAA
jgi:ferredoxin-nitrite reductase